MSAEVIAAGSLEAGVPPSAALVALSELGPRADDPLADGAPRGAGTLASILRLCAGR